MMGTTVETPILLLILILTLLFIIWACKMAPRLEVKVFIIVTGLSIFIYSGYGISYKEVKDMYIIKYVFALFFLYLPLLLLKKSSFSIKKQTSLDLFFESHGHLLKRLTLLYFIIVVMPMLYPRFRLFDVFSRGITIEDRYEYLNAVATDTIARICSMMATFIYPFFLANLVHIRFHRPKSVLPVVLFVLDICLGIMDACYIGRGGMIYSFVLLFFLWFCIKDGAFILTRMQITTLLVLAVCSLPLMYTYTYIRQGLSHDSMPFSVTVDLLFKSETDCPTYYDHILLSNDLKNQTPFSFLLWLVSLPIPSLIWPGKPSLANDAFTYSITGLHRTDIGYSSLVPSFLGEGFMYFGHQYYWLYAFIVGLILLLILRYLLKNRYLLFFALYLSVYSFSIGRAGATAVIPSFINGTLAVFLLDFLFIRRSKDLS